MCNFCCMQLQEVYGPIVWSIIATHYATLSHATKLHRDRGFGATFEDKNERQDR